ncbi:MAG: restriction endonuclease [Gammaproteobacteria bacterium]|nr:restriction endonuclease [Gammaproteobacteria bacterium]
MTASSHHLHRYVEAIRRSGLTIYDRIEVGDPNLWIPTSKLEELLNTDLVGISLDKLPLRSRSKVVKEHICRSLGYPVPASFKKTQPRFPGQNFDVYVQKSNNLQIWNEAITHMRRYVIIRVGVHNVINKVKVVTGHTLAQLDTTGTLTQKYQARMNLGEANVELITTVDTERLRLSVRPDIDVARSASPTDNPQEHQLLSIAQIFENLRILTGQAFPDTGHDQERNRGAVLHRLVCQHLDYIDYQDDGQFPDVRHQLLEVKLQTSPTIDLGLVSPNSQEALDIPMVGGQRVRHCDVRYALFYAMTDGEIVTLTHFYLTTGEKFFTRFPQFQGKVINQKIQILLPTTFFDSQTK